MVLIVDFVVRKGMRREERDGRAIGSRGWGGCNGEGEGQIVGVGHGDAL